MYHKVCQDTADGIEDQCLLGLTFQMWFVIQCLANT